MWRPFAIGGRYRHFLGQTWERPVWLLNQGTTILVGSDGKLAVFESKSQAWAVCARLNKERKLLTIMENDNDYCNIDQH